MPTQTDRSLPEMLGPFKNRIVDFSFVAVGELLAHPLNWRVHPKQQRDAVEGSISEFGWILPVLINKNTDYVVDGHLRVDVALEAGEETPVPVLWLDLTEPEEKALLLLVDHLTGMAVPDVDKMAAIIPDIRVHDDRLKEAFENLTRDYGLSIDPAAAFDPFESFVEDAGEDGDQSTFQITAVVNGPEVRDAAMKALRVLGAEASVKLVKGSARKPGALGKRASRN